MKIYRQFLQWALLLFTALLPLKFTHSVGVPEIPAFYTFDAGSFFLTTAPTFLFAFLAALLLLLTLFSCRQLPPVALLWAGVFCCAFAGICNASTAENVFQTLLYLAGLCCFAATVYLQTSADPTLGRKLLMALIAGAALALLHGWHQWLIGMEELRNFVAEEGHSDQMDQAMRLQIASERLYGPFQLCNTFGGYLAALLPLTFTMAVLWAKNNVKPPRQAMIFMGGIVLLIFAIPLWETGSRGAMLSAMLGIFAVLTVLFRTKKARLLLLGCGVLAGAACICMVIYVRGAESMIFRLDYIRAAFRMMFDHPFAGTGWGDFFTDYPALKQLQNDETPHSPHNLVMFFGAQCGLAGFFAALLLLGVPLFCGFKKLRRQYSEQGFSDQTLITAGLLASLTILSIHSLVEVGIEVPAYATLLILFSAPLCICETTEKQHPALRIATLTLLALLATVTLFDSFAAMKQEAEFSKLFELTSPLYHPQPNEPAIRKAYAEAPQDSPFVHLTMAKYLTATKRPAEAKTILDKAITLAPEHPGMRRIRIRLCMTLGLDAGPDIAFIRARDPNNPSNENLPDRLP